MSFGAQLSTTGSFMISLKLVALATSSTIICSTLGAQDVEKTNSILSQTLYGNEVFAIESFAHIPGAQENLAYSPLGVSEAFAMLYAGTRGETAKDISRVLRFADSPEKTLSSFGELQRTIEKLSEKDGFTIKIADSIWSTSSVLPSYKESIKSNLGAGAFSIKDLDETKEKMDKWVDVNTKGMIKQAPCELTPLTRNVLLNTVYLKGDWRSPFSSRKTRDLTFELASGESVKVPMMRQTSNFDYCEVEDAQIISMPYKGKDVSLLVVLPKEGLRLEDLEEAGVDKDFSPTNLGSWMSSLTTTKVKLSLPRFIIKNRIQIRPMLESMGLPSSVFETPDLSGMSKETGLKIDDAIQDVVFIVDEEGTEAAAVTAITVGARSRPRQEQDKLVVFNANRPFMFVLRDNTNGSILFMGRVMDPRWGGN